MTDTVHCIPAQYTQILQKGKERCIMPVVIFLALLEVENELQHCTHKLQSVVQNRRVHFC